MKNIDVNISLHKIIFLNIYSSHSIVYKSDTEQLNISNLSRLLLIISHGIFIGYPVNMFVLGVGKQKL